MPLHETLPDLPLTSSQVGFQRTVEHHINKEEDRLSSYLKVFRVVSFDREVLDGFLDLVLDIKREANHLAGDMAKGIVEAECKLAAVWSVHSDSPKKTITCR